MVWKYIIIYYHIINPPKVAALFIMSTVEEDIPSSSTQFTSVWLRPSFIGLITNLDVNVKLLLELKITENVNIVKLSCICHSRLLVVTALLYTLEAVPLGIEISHRRRFLVEVHINSNVAPLHTDIVLGWDKVVTAAHVQCHLYISCFIHWKFCYTMTYLLHHTHSAEAVQYSVADSIAWSTMQMMYSWQNRIVQSPWIRWFETIKVTWDYKGYTRSLVNKFINLWIMSTHAVKLRKQLGP